MSEFLHMGGYAAFVWPSYGLSALVLFLLVFLSIRKLKVTERLLKPLEEERQLARTQRRQAREKTV
ncbi:heme exporter protein CcmD [Sneathiella limimaris]|uniref:heme exporter protein CcmD n=1 Tax=Sneathiella limimaris TaxID=1964213 RepID=UPI00146C0BF6|nr:heme exporter protein CcmD [Sneathiella limimaris]